MPASWKLAFPILLTAADGYFRNHLEIPSSTSIIYLNCVPCSKFKVSLHMNLFKVRFYIFCEVTSFPYKLCERLSGVGIVTRMYCKVHNAVIFWCDAGSNASSYSAITQYCHGWLSHSIRLIPRVGWRTVPESNPLNSSSHAQSHNYSFWNAMLRLSIP